MISHWLATAGILTALRTGRQQPNLAKPCHKYRNSAVLTAAVLAAATLAAGCGGAIATRHADARPTRTQFCAVEISPPTPAQEAAVRRLWTPLTRSAFVVVTQG